MAAITPDLGHGAAVTFATGFVAKILSMDWSGITRNAIDSTTFETTGGKTFMPADTYDPGTLTVTMQFDSDASPPITSAAESVTLTFADLETWAASGFLTSYAITLADEEVMEATAEIKFTGSITF